MGETKSEPAKMN